MRFIVILWRLSWFANLYLTCKTAQYMWKHGIRFTSQEHGYRGMETLYYYIHVKFRIGHGKHMTNVVSESWCFLCKRVCWARLAWAWPEQHIFSSVDSSISCRNRGSAVFDVLLPEFLFIYSLPTVVALILSHSCRFQSLIAMYSPHCIIWGYFHNNGRISGQVLLGFSTVLLYITRSNQMRCPPDLWKCWWASTSTLTRGGWVEHRKRLDQNPGLHLYSC